MGLNGYNHVRGDGRMAGMTKYFQFISRLCLLSISLAVLSCAHSVKGPAIVEGKTSYRCEGKSILVETFLPKDGGQHPAVIVLYGSGGVLHGKGEMNAFARQLAEHGMAAYMIHYFDQTGTLLADDKSIAAYSAVWQTTVKEGVDFVSRQPQVRRGKMGVYGYSLGAFLTVASATTDSRIGVAAELSGGLFTRLKGHTQRFPPMLILHGRDDKRVSIQYAEELQQEAKRFHAQPVVHLYPGEGHALSSAAAADASARALNFLQQYLKP
jgi:dienelactone hydrolase